MGPGEYGTTIVQNAIVATTNTDLWTLTGWYPGARAILLEVVGSATPNWTVSFKGKSHADSALTSIDYIEVWGAVAGALRRTDLTVNDATARTYLLPNPPPYVRVASTRTAGTLTVRGAFFIQPWVPLTSGGGLEQTTAGITATGAGTAVNARAHPTNNYTMMVERTAGATPGVEVDLEVSVDGTDFVQIATITDLTVALVIVGSSTLYPANFFRYNVVTVGAGNTLQVHLLGVRS